MITRLLISILLLSTITSTAQEKDSIPAYTYFIEELDKGNLNIDYRDFRISYIYSEDFKKKGKSDYDSLKKEVYKNIGNKDYSSVLKLCNKMLEIDYTNMFAHKYMQQTAKITGDTTLYKKHHHIEFGLLKSIVHNGDGKSCGTSWEVTQIEEEYFILKMLGADLKKQILEGGCDKMIVKQDRKKRVHYFGVYYVFLSRK